VAAAVAPGPQLGLFAGRRVHLRDHETAEKIVIEVQRDRDGSGNASGRRQHRESAINTGAIKRAAREPRVRRLAANPCRRLIIPSLAEPVVDASEKRLHGESRPRQSA
jgi:hypothetical protein